MRITTATSATVVSASRATAVRTGASRRFMGPLGFARTCTTQNGGMRRRLVLVAVWLAGATVAVGLSMWAVGLVGGRIGGRDAALVSRHDVEKALVTPPTTPGVPPGAEVVTTEPATPRADQPSPPRAPDASASSAGPPVVPSTTGATAPPSTEEVYSTAGGTVGVRCVGSSISLLYATPAAGWQLHGPAGSGGTEIDVRFEPASDGKGAEVRVRVQCEGGVPVEEIRAEN